LLSLEANPNLEDINRLFRAMHTVKGSAAQVGLQRIGRVAHAAEDLVGRIRDGELSPTAAIVDICLESVDTLKKFLYRQWADEATQPRASNSLPPKTARLPRKEFAPQIPAEAPDPPAPVAAVAAIAETHAVALDAAPEDLTEEAATEALVKVAQTRDGAKHDLA